MLVITRKIGEEVYIFHPNHKEPIIVKIKRVDFNRIVLSIDAPREITILRKELLDEKPSDLNLS